MDRERLDIAADINRRVVFFAENGVEYYGTLGGWNESRAFVYPNGDRSKGLRPVKLSRVFFLSVEDGTPLGDDGRPATLEALRAVQVAPNAWAHVTLPGRTGKEAARARDLRAVSTSLEVENITAGRSGNNPRSWEAFKGIEHLIPSRAVSILERFGMGEGQKLNWTCDELEVALDMAHQSASSIISLLRKRNILRPNGSKRPTRLNSPADVLILAPREEWILSPPEAPSPERKLYD